MEWNETDRRHSQRGRGGRERGRGEEEERLKGLDQSLAADLFEVSS